MIKCCKNCEERYPGCHSDCKRYKKEREQNIKQKRWYKEAQIASTLHDNAFDKFLASAKSQKRR